ncbi:MAG: 4-hydroxybenzoate octaprenyltransferase, partial [Thiobacillus sp.]|nr:4-hydroxybenzoate octaprenyltransferase [Thiobacillus sp.]
VVLMRSAGCVINDYADRDFDSHVARTRGRPLAAGKVSPKEALLLAGGLALLAFLVVLPLGKLVIGLSFVALFLAASYPFTKRFLAIPQAYLGIAFGFGIPMSYAALWGSVPLEAWLLLAANVFWAVAYDTEYAMVDRVDDLKIGIKTSAITFGRFDLAAIAVCYAATLILLAWVGWQRQMDAIFYGGLGVAAAIALYHLKLIRHRDPQQCFRAFLHNSWFGAAVFGGIALNYLLRSL